MKKIPVRIKEPPEPPMSESKRDRLKPGHVYLLELAPGSEFKMAGEPVYGQVLAVNAGSVSVRAFRGEKAVEFKDRAGAVHSMSARIASVEAWSRYSIVVPKPSSSRVSAAEPRPISLRAAAQEDEIEAYQEVSEMAKKGNGRKGKVRSKAEKKGGNSCGCGCGEMVKRTFAQGHDSKYYGGLKRVADGRLKFSDLPASIQSDLGTISGVKAALAAHAR